MLIVQKEKWFRICAGGVAFLTFWFAGELPAQAALARQGREQSRRLEDVAQRLGFDPAAVRGGGDHEAAERAHIAARREDALSRLRARTAVPPAAVASAQERAREIHAAHAPALLAGIARTSEEARRAAKQLATARDEATRAAARKSLTAAGVGLRVALAQEERQRDRAAESRLAGALAKARQLAAAAERAVRGGDAREVARHAPAPARSQPDPRRRPALAAPLTPPRPRAGVRLGVELPEDVREFYAGVLDAPGIEVETWAGPLDPTMLAEGMLPEVRLATAGGLPELSSILGMGEGALGAPQAADVALTPETRVSPAMQQAVAAAGGSPIALFNLVHDGFDPDPYYGVKKGSVGAWEERGGNDADLSSLLVALLRTAGIPARFEYGTVDLTPEQAMAWTGTTDPAWAADVLYSTGVPATRILEGTKLVAVRVEHVWVRAYVPYTNYRGQPRAGSRSLWVRLDPTLKRARVRPALDLRGKVAFDYDAFLSSVSGRTPLELFEQQLRDYTRASGVLCKTLDDAIPARELVPDQLALLPAELPARIISSLATFAAFPASMRHAASVAVGTWSVALDLPQIYGSALTVRYRGASGPDDAAIAAAGGIAQLATPAATHVVPTLVVDGAEVGRGGPVLPGLEEELVVTLTVPHGGDTAVRHHVNAGSVYALAFPVGTVPDSMVAAREAELQRAVTAGATGDDLEAARGNRAVWRYFWHLDREEPRLFALEWIRLGRDVSEGIAGRELASELLYGTPVQVSRGRFIIDAPRYSLRPYGVDGPSPRTKAMAELSGYHGSTREHLIWEETVNVPAISTVRLLQAARQVGVPLLALDATSTGVVASLPYSDRARDDIANALHAGLVVTVPQRPVSWGTYATTEAYVLEDPLTGAADFRLLGLFSGGAADGSDSPKGQQCPVCSGPNPQAASNVNIAFGNMFFSETDLTLPARGIPIAFGRRYDSMSPYGGRLGPGWHHSYEARLIAAPDGSMVCVNDAFQAERFQLNADGSFTTPAGYHETLQATADGYRLAFLSGAEYRFRADGQLSAIRDPNQHEVALAYDAAGKLVTVTDATGRPALTFAYDDAGLLASVTDATQRTVSFGHLAGDLMSVTDVLGHAGTYTYDANHRLSSKTDKNGNTTYELYDGDGRWVHAAEPDGAGRSVSYDFVNRRAVHTDKRGFETIWEYNERGNPIAVTDALGNRRALEWDGAHDKLSETDARGNRTAMSYDADGNVLTRTDATGAITGYTYDARGQVLTVADARGVVVQNTYLANGNLETTTDATGAVTRYTYTADGLPSTIQQPGGATTILGYRTDGSVETIQDAEGGSTSLGYDAYGHLSTITDALGNIRTLEADAAGRIVSMTDAAQHKTTFEYDAQGNRKAVVDAAGNRTRFDYDAMNRLVTVTDAQGHATRTEYDEEGSVTARVDALGRRTTYTYDAVGRVAEVTDATGHTTTQAYCADAGGQPCGVVDALGNLTQVTLDALGRVTTTLDASGATTTQHYDTLGRRDWSEDAEGRRTAYAYDAAGRLLTVKDPAGGVTAYGYDARGNRTSVTDANGHQTTFTYDRANRLLTETNPLQIQTTYEYDAAGNRRFKTDGNGSRTEYQYDGNRRLRRVLFADGTSYDFDYDARGNRTIEKSPTHLRETVYDGL